MNRKQRRALGRPSAGTAAGSRATAPGATPADIFAAAAANHRAGAFAAAERQYRQILAIDPNHGETHSRIGAVLMAQGKIDDALAHLERAVAINPDLFEAFANLAQAYLAAGQYVQAVNTAQRALELRETIPGKILFAECAGAARFAADNARLRILLLRALSEGWTRPRVLDAACVSLIKSNPVVNECIARAASAWPKRLTAGALFGASGLAALSAHELLIGLLKCDPIGDRDVERLLTDVRGTMLALASAGDQSAEERHLEFFAAVAQQCFINEYVYAPADDEALRASDLQSALAQSLRDGKPVPPLWPVTVAAYFPLHAVPGADALLQRSWPGCVQAVLDQQIAEPRQERRLAAVMPVLTGIEDDVSRAVRAQYEENPYPRWTTACSLSLPAPSGRNASQAPEILIAGCGTGLSAIDFARQAPAARILAVDLSLASLGYAKRKALKLGFDKIQFAQGDILQLAGIGRTFDFIDASGVLHHLADPWAGWTILLSLLRPGGAMQVGLYSELGRDNIVAARAFIAKQGYRPTPRDIGRCRQDIFASSDPLLTSLVRSQDFYTTSECRDLMFHAHEVRITLPEIKTFLIANNLSFAGFNLQTAALRKFIKRFPKREALTDLDCWHVFERDEPQTFRGMYQFEIGKLPAPAGAGTGGST